MEPEQRPGEHADAERHRNEDDGDAGSKDEGQRDEPPPTVPHRYRQVGRKHENDAAGGEEGDGAGEKRGEERASEEHALHVNGLR